MATKYEMFQDLAHTPLGLGKDEGKLQVPFNSTNATARVYMVNHSATRKRRYTKIAVSERRNLQQALLADKELQKIHNIETLRQSIKEGYDQNVYADKVQPVIYRVLHDSKSYLIEPAKDAETEPVAHLIPEGAWDMFMGNYERKNNGTPAEQAQESARLALQWMTRHSPIWKVTVDGETTEIDNPFGYIEIVRLTEKEAPQQLDKDFLTALELAE